MVSFCTPCTFTLNLFLVYKKVNENLKIDGKDFTCATFGVSCFVYQVLAFVHFSQNDNSFDFNLWVKGSIAGFFNFVGCIFSISAYCTMAPAGQVAALTGSQTIVVFIISAILLGRLPSSLQFIGLIFGIFGALTLTVLTEMKALWRHLT